MVVYIYKSWTNKVRQDAILAGFWSFILSLFWLAFKAQTKVLKSCLRACSAPPFCLQQVQPPDLPQERKYREFCATDFRHITSASAAVEIEGAPQDRRIAIKIPFNVLQNQNTKILVSNNWLGLKKILCSGQPDPAYQNRSYLYMTSYQLFRLHSNYNNAHVCKI